MISTDTTAGTILSAENLKIRILDCYPGRERRSKSVYC